MPSIHVKAGCGNICITQHTREMTGEIRGLLPSRSTQIVSSRLSKKPCLLSTKVENNWGGPSVSVSSFHTHTLTTCAHAEDKAKTDGHRWHSHRQEARKEGRKNLNARGKLPLKGHWPERPRGSPETIETMATVVNCPWELEGKTLLCETPGALVQDMKKQSWNWVGSSLPVSISWY